VNDLNIRAAKCLGWKHYTINRHLWRVDHGLVAITGCPYGAESKDLKFTTSYDWAMLGVKELLKLEHIANDDEEYGPYSDFMDALSEADGLGLSIYQRDYVAFQSTPEEITKAWAEVLEGK